MTKKNEITLIAYNKGYRVVEGNVVYNGRIRSLNIDSRGYFKLKIRDLNNESINCDVHKLIAYQKFGDKLFENGIQVRHLDGNRLNNKEDNIEIGTASENAMDKPKALRQRVSKYANKKYSDSFIYTLREERNKGLTYKDLHEKYGITKSTLSYYLGKPDRKRKEVIL